MFFTSIPTTLLMSEDLNNKDKYVYLKLKQNSSKGKSVTTISKIKKYSDVSDNRTILKSLSKLKEFGFINYPDFDVIPRTSIAIEIFDSDESFIKIDNEIFEKIELLFKPNQHNAIILYYYLEKEYNINYGYACPSRDEISSVTKLNNGKVSEITKIMHDNFICEFQQGDKIENDVNEFGYTRMRNRYIPNTIKYSKDGVTNNQNNERRYKRHKNKQFFFKDG